MGAYATWKFKDYIFESKHELDSLVVIYHKLPEGDGIIVDPEPYGSNHISHSQWDGRDQLEVAKEIVKRFPFGKSMIRFMLKNDICFNHDQYKYQLERFGEEGSLPLYSGGVLIWDAM